MLLEIAQLGQPVLRQVAKEISPELIQTSEFKHFLEEMGETLHHEKGAGLAAPQVFVSERVFLAMLPSPGAEEDGLVAEVFINPCITPLGENKVSAWEGCLSFPELMVLVPRFYSVRIVYLNPAGQTVAKDLHDFPARVVQHELDHLDGILTLDRAVSTHDIIKASEIDSVTGLDSAIND